MKTGFEEKMDYFLNRTERDFTEVKKDIENVNRKIDSLLAFKFMLFGGSAVVSTVVAIIINIGVMYLKNRG